MDIPLEYSYGPRGRAQQLCSRLMHGTPPSDFLTSSWQLPYTGLHSEWPRVKQNNGLNSLQQHEHLLQLARDVAWAIKQFSAGHDYNAFQLPNSTAQCELMDMSHCHESGIGRFLLLCGLVWCKGSLC
jgi:hypothetical protein